MPKPYYQQFKTKKCAIDNIRKTKAIEKKQRPKKFPAGKLTAKNFPPLKRDFRKPTNYEDNQQAIDPDRVI